jgi:hypothetical protein
MSLRAFHLFFIGTAILLALYFCGWCYFEHARTRAPLLILEATLSFISAGCLVAYGTWAQRRYSSLDKASK